MEFCIKDMCSKGCVQIDTEYILNDSKEISVDVNTRETNYLFMNR
jgi:lipocalin